MNDDERYLFRRAVSVYEAINRFAEENELDFETALKVMEVTALQRIAVMISGLEL